jgi:hypothetical protein
MNPEPASGDSNSDLVRLVRWRWLVLVTVAVAGTVLAGGRGDWDFFVSSGKAMFDVDGFSVYAHHGDTQTGPLSLVIARLFAFTPRNGFLLCSISCLALGLVSLRAVERIGRGARDAMRAELLTLIGGVGLLAWWGQFSGYGHLDDAIVLTIAAVVVERRLQGGGRWSAVLIGLAIAVKPWAVFFLPLTLGVTPGNHTAARTRDTSLRTRARALVGPLLAVAVAAVCWAPFVIADSGTLRALRPTVNLAPDSVLALFISDSSSIPEWLRTAQLVLGLALGLVLVLRGRALALPLACIALRLAIDPGTWAYFTPGLLIGALLLDARESRTCWPVLTIAATVLLAPPSIVPSDVLGGVMRALACVGAIVVAWGWPARRREAQAGAGLSLPAGAPGR